MDVAWSLGPTSVAAFILFIGILIFVHELGHFLAAKLFDIKVLKFSLGFGPPLVQFQWGETTYQVAAVPLGGFVRMLGDNPSEPVEGPEKARAFDNAAVYQRAIVALAGPAFNLAFPVLCFFAYFLLGPRVHAPEVGIVDPSRPAAEAGLRPGDRVLEVEDNRIYSFERMSEVISDRPKTETNLRVLRDGEVVEVKLVPDEGTRENLFGETVPRGVIGVHLQAFGTRLGVFDERLLPAPLKTGDAIVRIDGVAPESWSDVRSALVQARGRTVEILVSRPRSAQLGDVLHASLSEPHRFQLEVPLELDQPEELGIAPGSQFIRSVVPDGAAARAGLLPGDRVRSVDGHRTVNYASFAARVLELGGEPVEVEVERGGRAIRATLVPAAVSCIHETTKLPKTEYDSGFGRGPLAAEPTCLDLTSRQWTFAAWHSSAPIPYEQATLSIPEAFVAGVRETGGVIANTSRGLAKLFTNEVSVSNVGGPLRLFQLASQAAELGIFVYLGILAAVSVNLGLVNLLPIPIFDGGHLLFCLIEAIKRKPLSVRTREYASLFGLLFIISLFALAMHNDILALQ